MFSVRSLNPRLCFHRKIHSLLENFIVYTNNASYSDIRTSNEGEKNETNQFQAAMLHPKKQNLVVETIVFPDAAKEGMVRTIIGKFSLFFCYKKICFYFKLGSNWN